MKTTIKYVAYVLIYFCLAFLLFHSSIFAFDEGAWNERMRKGKEIADAESQRFQDVRIADRMIEVQMRLEMAGASVTNVTSVQSNSNYQEQRSVQK